MDIPKPNFKQILEKLSVFKNNLSLLVPVIIAVVSVLLFIPTQLMSSRLRQRVADESIRKGGDQVRRHTEGVVSNDQYEKEAERQKAHANDANEIALLAVQTTQRELLSYDLFPEPDPNGFSGLVFQQFGLRFRNGIEQLVARVNGRDCPTDVELERGRQDASGRSGARRGGGLGGYGGGYGGMDMYSQGTLSGGRGGMSGMMGPLDRMIVDQMCEARAREISVYVNPIDLSGYEYWNGYKYEVKKEEAVADCWYHQLAYWTIEDVFDTIAAMNAGHDNVLTAPVKRFLRITFTMGMKRPGGGGGGRGVFTGFSRRKNTQGKKDDADKPAYMLAATEGLTESCTGRFSEKDGDIDVIHFNVAVVVGTKQVLPFMEQLCSAKQHKFRGYSDGAGPEQNFKHNQITILESSTGAISLTGMDHRNYSYGDENVVELNLVCEYIFNKKGYEPIVPETVKETLAGEDATK
ncbi:MAG: hypothetical protein ABIF19_01595 [Planctomycetota bacterium]